MVTQAKNLRELGYSWSSPCVCTVVKPTEVEDVINRVDEDKDDKKKQHESREVGSSRRVSHEWGRTIFYNRDLRIEACCWSGVRYYYFILLLLSYIILYIISCCFTVMPCNMLRSQKCHGSNVSCGINRYIRVNIQDIRLRPQRTTKKVFDTSRDKDITR